MATEWIDIVDTAVKIGLGALISGVTTYKISNLNHRKDVQKTVLSKKIDIVEEISELAEKYFYFATFLNNRVGGIQKRATNIGERLTDTQRKKISECHEGFVELLETRNKAISKIKLLSIPQAEVSLSAYNDAISEFREVCIFQGMLPTLEESNEFGKKIKQNKNEFYIALSAYMNTIGT